MATIKAYSTAAGKRYRVRYRTPDRRQTDKRGFKTKRDAELFAASIEVDKASGKYIDPAAARVTVGDLGPAWLKRQTHLKPSSYRPIDSSWRNHVQGQWSNVIVSDIRPTAIQTWVSELSTGRSATTVIRAFGVLAAILDDAVADRRILSNPARGVKLPRKTKREHVYLSHAQVAALADHAGEHSTLVYVLAYTGLRWGEAAGLRVKDVDTLRRRLTVAQNAVEVGSRIVVGTPKNHRRRTVPFPKFMVEMVAGQCEGKAPDDPVFDGDRGGLLKRSRTTDGWFKHAAGAAGIVGRFSPHDLRHTAASMAVSAGANVKAVQKMLGHSSAAMTLDVYSDLFEDDLNDVADALDDARSSSNVGKMWAESDSGQKGNPVVPLKQREQRG